MVTDFQWIMRGTTRYEDLKVLAINNVDQGPMPLPYISLLLVIAIYIQKYYITDLLWL